nr:hypothetical protein CFP56_11846 [Quercus suber]
MLLGWPPKVIADSSNEWFRVLKEALRMFQSIALASQVWALKQCRLLIVYEALGSPTSAGGFSFLHFSTPDCLSIIRRGRAVMASVITPRQSCLIGDTLSFRHNPWLPMASTWLMSLLMVLAMAITLKEYDSKSFVDWDLPITLNALVSVMVTVLYIFIMSTISLYLGQLRWSHYRTSQSLLDLDAFDSASRSVLGSLKLIFRVPRK